jgi:hypothetical protein
LVRLEQSSRSGGNNDCRESGGDDEDSRGEDGDDEDSVGDGDDVKVVGDRDDVGRNGVCGESGMVRLMYQISAKYRHPSGSFLLPPNM